MYLTSLSTKTGKDQLGGMARMRSKTPLRSNHNWATTKPIRW